MHQKGHEEEHFTSGALVRDVVIGMADGLTVPFALAAGLSGAVVATGVIVTAGLAEVAAGSIAMGLGGYLAARGDADHYASELAREQMEVIEKPEAEAHEVAEVLQEFGLTAEDTAAVIKAFHNDHDAWVRFMMRFELGLEQPNPNRALASAVTIASSYIVGGLIPLAPYMLIAEAGAALKISLTVTILALLIFGFYKGRFTGAPPMRSALQTALIGGIAASAAFGIAKAIS